MHQWVITDLSLFAKVMIMDEYIVPGKQVKIPGPEAEIG